MWLFRILQLAKVLLLTKAPNLGPFTTNISYQKLGWQHLLTGSLFIVKEVEMEDSPCLVPLVCGHGSFLTVGLHFHCGSEGPSVPLKTQVVPPFFFELSAAGDQLVMLCMPAQCLYRSDPNCFFIKGSWVICI